MGLRKSKTEEFDVNGLLDDINQQENLKAATTEVDVQIDELRNVCLELGDYFQKMDKARKTIDQYLMVATKIEYDGKTAADTIVNNIHNAVEETKRITIQANLNPDSLKSISAFSQAFAESEKAVLEAHAEKQKSLLQNYHYKFCNMLDKNQGVWLSPIMCKVLLWIICPCVVVTIVVITLAISMALGK